MSAQIQIMDVLQWAAIVFAAGFIGFFGKYLGRVILNSFHREAPSPRAGDAGGLAPGRTARAGDTSGGEGPAMAVDARDGQGNGEKDGKIIKKQQKALLKQEKKRAKDTSGR